jgi:3-oxoadipate enol-lactonase / 4-carboxymuconolactone decarboxylase
MTDDDTLDRGRRRRAELEMPGKADTGPGFEAEYRDFVDRYVFGEVWSRPGLDARTRSCVTVAMLVAQGRTEPLGVHLRTALKNGATADELREILFHGAVYCGIPSATAAFKVADEVLGRPEPIDAV